MILIRTESARKEVIKLEKQDLLKFDYFDFEGLDNINNDFFMEIIEGRHKKNQS